MCVRDRRLCLLQRPGPKGGKEAGAAEPYLDVPGDVLVAAGPQVAQEDDACVGAVHRLRLLPLPPLVRIRAGSRPRTAPWEGGNRGERGTRLWSLCVQSHFAHAHTHSHPPTHTHTHTHTALGIIDGTGSVGAAVGQYLVAILAACGTVGPTSACTWTPVFVMMMCALCMAGVFLSTMVVTDLLHLRKQCRDAVS